MIFTDDGVTFVNDPDVDVDGDGVLVLHLVRVDDVWVSVNDRSVAVSG